MKIEDIAKVCHEANASLCETQLDVSQLPWSESPEWQQNSAINGVMFHLANPDAGPDASHNAWLTDKVVDGWVYGPVKDAEKKEHPCMVPYEELDKGQQAKDYLFKGIVHSLSKFVD